MNEYVPKQKRQKIGKNVMNVNRISAANPVLQIELYKNSKEGKKAPRIDPIQSKNILADMLYPLDPSTFMNQYFQKKAIHISSKGTLVNDRMKELISEQMFNLDIESIFNETSSDNIFIWLSPNSHSKNKQASKNSSNTEFKSISTNIEQSSALQSIEISSPSTALALHHVGHATYCRASPELEQYFVSSLLRSTGFGCGQYDPSGSSSTTLGRGEIEVFVGTKGHYTNWHFDFQENFTIQLSGKKRWRLKQGHVKFPMRGCTPHYYALNNHEMNESVVESQLKSHRLSNPNFEFGRQTESTNTFGDEVEIDMYPGDILYFPAGMWHSVETLEPGVSINISLMAKTYANVVCDSLQHLLLKKEAWRQTILNHIPDHSKDDGQFFLSKVKDLLKDLPLIVKEFVTNGGEQALFPPVLRMPPSFTHVGIATKRTEDEINENVANEIINHHQDVDDQSSSSSIKNEIVNESNEDNCSKAESQSSSCSEIDFETKDDNDIIDVNTYEPPLGWIHFDFDHHCKNRLRETFKKYPYKIVKNPLATLTKKNDVTCFYTKLDQITNQTMNQTNKNHLHENGYDENKEKKEYILNIAFAGNEMHESSIRTVLYESEETDFLEQITIYEKKSKDPASLFDTCMESSTNEKMANPLLCLFYYGYFYWVKKMKCLVICMSFMTLFQTVKQTNGWSAQINHYWINRNQLDISTRMLSSSFSASDKTKRMSITSRSSLGNQNKLKGGTQLTMQYNEPNLSKHIENLYEGEIVGAGGRMGSFLSQRGSKKLYSVPRHEKPGFHSPIGKPIYVTTPADAISSVMDMTPKHRWADLVLICNGIFSDIVRQHLSLNEKDDNYEIQQDRIIDDMTLVVPHFGILTIGGDPVGGQSSHPPTAIYGKHADALMQLIKPLNTIKVQTLKQIQIIAARKLLWACAMWLLTLDYPQQQQLQQLQDWYDDDSHQQQKMQMTVQMVHETKTNQLITLIEELIPAVNILAGESIGSLHDVLQYLESYSLSMPSAKPSIHLALAEINQRNGRLISVKTVRQPFHSKLIERVSGKKLHQLFLENVQ